jgi:peroxiredoxin
VSKSYDAVLTIKPDYANRTSYVIGQNGTIVYQYTSLNPFKHVSNTMNALKALKR